MGQEAPPHPPATWIKGVTREGTYQAQGCEKSKWSKGNARRHPWDTIYVSLKHTQMSSLFINTFMCCKSIKICTGLWQLLDSNYAGVEGGLNWSVPFRLIFEKGSEANIPAINICYVWVVGI